MEFPQKRRFQVALEIVAGKKVSSSWYSLPSMRGRYNRGELIPSHNGVRKGPISFRYNDKGEKISNYNYHHLMKPEEYDIVVARYGPDNRSTQDFDWSYKLVAPPKNKGGRPSYKSFDWCI